jgi:hypothetical protein
MKRMMIALAVSAGLGLCANAAFADPGGYAPPGGPAASGFPSFAQMGGPNTLIGAGDLPPGRGPDMYGLNPCLKRFFHIPAGGGKHGGGHAPGYGYGPNWGAAGYGMGGPAYGANAGVMQGTLVFPHHTFVRSPRDFFMMDLNK